MFSLSHYLLVEKGPGDELFYQPFKQAQSTIKRRILYPWIKPGGCFHDCFSVAEGFKRIFSVIIARAAKSPAAKGEAGVGEVPAGVVNTGAARRHGIRPLFFFLCAGSEYINSERVGVECNNGQRLFDR